MKITIRIEKKWNASMGVRDGRIVYHAWVLDTGGAPFTGCPLGRAFTEQAAIEDLIRPGYSLPFGTTVRLSDCEVVQRHDFTE